MNPRTLVAVFGYAGDVQQIRELMPVYEHHQTPIVILSPDDSQIHGMGPHICRTAGKRAYVGQDSWDRQHAQLKILLEYPFDFYLLNDSDSFVLTPELPDYLFEHKDVVFSNEVKDFRVPGTNEGNHLPEGRIWPADYHAGYPLIAMQPPYFLSREALQRLVDASAGMVACPITPFIDWWFVPACVKAGLRHEPFRAGASCETVTPMGLAVMSQRIVEYGATFIHSVKSGAVKDQLQALHLQNNSSLFPK